MKKTLITVAILALLPAGAALADSDDCQASRDQWQSREAAMHFATEKGWTVRDFEIDDGCYEIEGHDGQGREFEAKLDPAKLQIIEMDYDDDHDGRRGVGDSAPAGKVAPPRNGLLGNGAPPKVQVN